MIDSDRRTFPMTRVSSPTPFHGLKFTDLIFHFSTTKARGSKLMASNLAISHPEPRSYSSKLPGNEKTCQTGRVGCPRSRPSEPSRVPIKAIFLSPRPIKLLKRNNNQEIFTFHEHFRHLTGDSMARTAMSMGLAMVLVTMLCARAMAQSDCTSVLISLSPCLNYITGNSSTPSSQCCTQLASVVRSSPQCLCQVLNGGGASLGINVNQTQAIALPGACKVQTPPISSCNGASPAASPAGAPEAPSSPSGTGSKTVPSTQTDGTSGASSIKFSIPLLLLLFSASYVSAFTKIF
ncbi:BIFUNCTIONAL INHIBITOR/LIPID-TRANSFER PROTEIN/SEED STORAGE 2S ALBUMIN SUPERFAMILY PROTEIN [Salix purpurea]|uniref:BIFUNCTIONAL INHIBITOR/LIPID-TRANSFER PROTEIN/SEED STORAGE 2S ALBUMIN SUPERFAMILY PROTEIN n=1 Tax=Salix purpurea TaxID=77065 RepID=A0A9Q0Z9B5_SALPP|nr:BIFUNCTIONAL INHIBITOR/LIPID-TRANSFER PROTEIN/SEED STORAGE 2S ALBUMIN SUPERFAMILY PROTEIN [Salix purpurea]